MERKIIIKPIEKSLRFIIETSCSVARFGDGEMDIIAGQSIPYQAYDAELAERLRTIMGLESSERFMVCLSDVFEDRERYNYNFSFFWDGHLERFGHLYDEICQAPWYGSTFISRPYIDLEDKAPAAHNFALLKQIWADKDILIVEGETSRSGVGNDLFAQAKSVSRIICPSKNAYARYDEIASAIRQHGKDKLVLLMLGPTAKVLSYELSREGFWTIDLGHIDSEYEWFLMGATHKVKLDHKHTAEHNYDEGITFTQDKEYEEQIVQRIGLKRLVFAVAADDGYASHLGTLFYSLVKHHPHYDIVVYVLHQSFNATTIHYFKQVEQVLEGLKIELVPVETTLFDGISLGNTHLSVATFYRLLLPELLVNEDRVIYLDVDVLVVDSLVPIWEWPMANQALAGVKEEYIYNHRSWHFEKIGLDSSCDYINAGVLVMNLTFFREQKVVADLLDFAVKHANQFPLFDQDVLNCYFQNSLSLLDKKYNYHNDFLMTRDYMSEEKAIIHYGGSASTKPWYNLALLSEYIKPAVAIYRQYREEFLECLATCQSKVGVLLACDKDLPNYDLLGTLDSLILQTYANLTILLFTDNVQADWFAGFSAYQASNPRLKLNLVSSLESGISEYLISQQFETIFVVHPHDVVEKDYVLDMLWTMEKEKTSLIMSDYHHFEPESGLTYYHNALESVLWQDADEFLRDQSSWKHALEGKGFKTSLFTDISSDQPLLPALVGAAGGVTLFPKQAYLVRGNHNWLERLSTVAILEKWYRTLSNEETPLISVIIPVYNVENYLEECVCSVRQQTYQNLEIILVDDGSTDNSGNMCDQYAEEDSRVKVIHKSNGGVSDARNAGLEVATGDYVTFVDSDDGILEDFVKDSYQQVVDYGADIVVSTFFQYSEPDNCFYYYADKSTWGQTEVVSCQQVLERQIIWGHLNTTPFVVTWAKLFKKDLFETVRFPLGRFCEDEATTHKLFLQAEKIVFLNKDYYMSRRRADSAMGNQYSPKKSQDYIWAMEERMIDLTLAGYDPMLVKDKLVSVLQQNKSDFEHQGMTDTDAYKKICQRLSLVK